MIMRASERARAGAFVVTRAAPASFFDQEDERKKRILFRSDVLVSEVGASFLRGGSGGKFNWVGVVASCVVDGADVFVRCEDVFVFSSEVSVVETAAFVDLGVVFVKVIELY